MTENKKTPFEIPIFRQRLETYLGTDRATAEKDIYRFLHGMLQSDTFIPKTILDMGCATGDLLIYLSKYYPHATISGLDFEENLIQAAREREALRKADMRVGDVMGARLGKYQLVLCFGMIGIFDSFEPLLEKLVEHAEPAGRIYIQGLLNPDDIDVRIAYRDNLNDKDWMRGFNIFSRKRVKDWCSERNLISRFHDFHMVSDLPRRPRLPHRAYTVDLANGKRRVTNGLCLLLPETLLEIRIPS